MIGFKTPLVFGIRYVAETDVPAVLSFQIPSDCFLAMWAFAELMVYVVLTGKILSSSFSSSTSTSCISSFQLSIALIFFCTFASRASLSLAFTTSSITQQ